LTFVNIEEAAEAAELLLRAELAATTVGCRARRAPPAPAVLTVHRKKAAAESRERRKVKTELKLDQDSGGAAIFFSEFFFPPKIASYPRL
jgi:hypothetical protein